MTIKNVLLGLVFSIVFVLPTNASNDFSVKACHQEMIKPEVTIIFNGIVDGSMETRVMGSASSTATLIVTQDRNGIVFTRKIKGGDVFEIPASVLQGNYRIQLIKANGTRKTLLEI